MATLCLTTSQTLTTDFLKLTCSSWVYSTTAIPQAVYSYRFPMLHPHIYGAVALNKIVQHKGCSTTNSAGSLHRKQMAQVKLMRICEGEHVGIESTEALRPKRQRYSKLHHTGRALCWDSKDQNHPITALVCPSYYQSSPTVNVSRGEHPAIRKVPLGSEQTTLGTSTASSGTASTLQPMLQREPGGRHG